MDPARCSVRQPRPPSIIEEPSAHFAVLRFQGLGGNSATGVGTGKPTGKRPIDGSNGVLAGLGTCLLIQTAVTGSLAGGAPTVMSTDYTVWGQQKNQSFASNTSLGYADGYEDPSGLYYMINRYYDPATRQFLTVDPAVLTTMQPYSFTPGDPINGRDPLGLGCCFVPCLFPTTTPPTPTVTFSTSPTTAPTSEHAPSYWPTSSSWPPAYSGYGGSSAGVGGSSAGAGGQSAVGIVSAARRGIASGYNRLNGGLNTGVSTATAHIASASAPLTDLVNRIPGADWVNRNLSTQCIVTGVLAAWVAVETGGGDMLYLAAKETLSVGEANGAAAGIGFTEGCFGPPAPSGS